MVLNTYVNASSPTCVPKPPVFPFIALNRNAHLAMPGFTNQSVTASYGDLPIGEQILKRIDHIDSLYLRKADILLDLQT